jgi:hypothetical protein
MINVQSGRRQSMLSALGLTQRTDSNEPSASASVADAEIVLCLPVLLLLLPHTARSA